MSQNIHTIPQNLRDTVREEPSLYQFEAQLEVVPIGLVPEGIRMANTFEGRVVEGILRGGRVWGIDHFVLRNDGVGILDAQKTISLGDVHLHEHVHGYCLPPEDLELPPLEALLEPGFEWPDVPFAIQGFSYFRAAAPELVHLNRALASIDGWASFATGALVVETRLMRHQGRVRPLDRAPRLDVAIGS